MNTNRVVKKYLKAIQRALPFSYLTSKTIIKEIRQAIYESKVDHLWTLEELYNNFGTPEEVADSFLSADTNKRLNKKVVKIRALFIGVSVLVILIIIFVIAFATTNGDSTYMTNYGTLKSN